MQAKSLICLMLLSTMVYTSSCANDRRSPVESVTDSLSPVETKKANTNYKPAFAGQTRISAVKTKTSYKVDKIAGGLGNPWAVVPMPDGRLLITDKSGYMEIYKSDGSLAKKITGFPPVDNRGQGGMLDVALDPAFNKNKTIYWSYSERSGNGNLMAVAKGQLNESTSKVDNPQVIFRATPSLSSTLHFGSRLVFDMDENLFVSTGERSILEGV